MKYIIKSPTGPSLQKNSLSSGEYIVFGKKGKRTVIIKLMTLILEEIKSVSD